MTVNLLSGSLLHANLTPVRGRLVQGEVYRLKLKGSTSARTIKVKLYTPPAATGVLSRVVEAIARGTEGLFWRRITIRRDDRGAPVELLVKISSLNKYLKSVEHASKVEPSMPSAVEAPVAKKSTPEMTPERAKMIRLIEASKADWERKGRDVTVTNEDGNTIHYAARTRSIQFTSGDIIVDYTNGTEKKYHLPTLSNAERISLHNYLKENLARLQNTAKEKRRQRDAQEIRAYGRVMTTWPESVYIHPKNTGHQIPRAIQVDESGRVVLHYNRVKKGDKLLGRGSFKKVKRAIDIETGAMMASVSTKDLRAISALRLLQRFPNSATIHGISYCENGKTRFLMQLCNEGDLGDFIEKHLSSGTTPTLTEQQDIFIDSIVALRQLHDNGYTHRDVKPANFLRHKEGETSRTILADYDMMCHESDIGTKKRWGGTLMYFAPEYLDSIISKSETKLIEATTPALDVWALGCTLHEAFYRSLPIWMEQTTMEGMLTCINALELEKPEDENSLEYLLYRMLDRNPATRITMKEAEEFLVRTGRMPALAGAGTYVNPAKAILAERASPVGDPILRIASPVVPARVSPVDPSPVDGRGTPPAKIAEAPMKDLKAVPAAPHAVHNPAFRVEAAPKAKAPEIDLKAIPPHLRRQALAIIVANQRRPAPALAI